MGAQRYFTPIFLLGFPLLGPQYALTSTATAVGVALFTETFGFSSGFIGYSRRRLIDFRTARPFILVSVPIAIIGALTAHLVDSVSVEVVYAMLMLALAIVLIRHREVARQQSPEYLRLSSESRVW